MMNMLMIVALIAIFYFFMIAPQRKREKKINEFRSNINGVSITVDKNAIAMS